MKERPRKWFHETTVLALSLTPYIAPDDTDIKDRRVFAGFCQPCALPSVRRSGLGWRSRSQMSAIVRTISPVVASTISTDQASQ